MQNKILTSVFIFLFIISFVSAYQKLDSIQYNLLNETLDTHLNYFLSNDSVTSYGMILGAYKVNDRARFGYSNPTEWGYLLQAYIVAAERGKINKTFAVSKINKTLDTLGKLQNNSSEVYLGLYYPIYKVVQPDGVNKGNDIFPYAEKTDSNGVETGFLQGIPSIDNGFLYMSLLIVDGWARENNYTEISSRSQVIYNKMNFSGFVFSENGNLYMTHAIFANNGSVGTSKWNIYADEGGMMTIIEYLSGSINLTQFNNITSSQVREARTYQGITANEAAYFNSMFTWAVRSLAGIDVTGSRYSTHALIPSFKAHLAYADLYGVNYPAFSDAMTLGLVGYYIPMNYPNQVPTPRNHITPHALFVPLNVLADLDQATINRIFQEISSLRNDTQGYYFNSGPYPYGFVVTASKTENVSNYQGYVSLDGQTVFGKLIFETLSHAYTSFSIFNALQYEDLGKDFSDYISNVPGIQTKINNVWSSLYPICTDNDNDGYSLEGGACGLVDCNDNDFSVNPGQNEICGNGKDDDCDGKIDVVDEECAVGCITPSNNYIIMRSGDICPASYSASNVSFGKDNLVIDCKGAVSFDGYVSNTFIIENRKNITIKNCNINNNNYPVRIYSSENCIIEGNYFNNIFDSSIEVKDSRNITIKNNKRITGQYQNGINFLNVVDSVISGNIINSSGNLGSHSHRGAIALFNSNNNRIYNNNLSLNYRSVYLSSSSGNIIYKNNFINNTATPSTSLINYWNSSGIGNYWSNYYNTTQGCNDSNVDKVCDSPYLIASSNVDNYPFTNQSGWIFKIKSVNLTKGWNLISPMFGAEDTNTNRTILLNKGWNLFGYSANNSFNWSNALVINGTQSPVRVDNISQSGKFIQPTIYSFYNGSYQLVSTPSGFLDKNKGYWIYALGDNLTLVLPNVGGYLPTNPLYWSNVKIINSTQTNTVNQAANNGQIQSTMYYYSQGYKFVPENEVNVNPWRGYWLYSFKDNLTLTWEEA